MSNLYARVTDPVATRAYLADPRVIYLEDSVANVMGLSIYGCAFALYNWQ